jgi:hypothetical protein
MVKATTRSPSARTLGEKIREECQCVKSEYASAQSEHFCVAVNTMRQEFFVEAGD